MKNIDTINKEIAKTKKLPLDTVAKINDYYWSTVKDSLRSLDHQFIHVKEIGTFEASGFKLNKLIQNIRNYIKNIRNSKKFNDATKEQIIKDYKERYRKCVAMRKEVAETINFFKTYRDDEFNTD